MCAITVRLSLKIRKKKLKTARILMIRIAHIVSKLRRLDIFGVDLRVAVAMPPTDLNIRVESW